MSRISPVKMPLAPVSTFSRPECEEASSSSVEEVLVGKVTTLVTVVRVAGGGGSQGIIFNE